MQASGKASGHGRAHCRRAGAPTRRVTVRPTKKQERKIVFADDGWCLSIRQGLKGQMHGNQSAEGVGSVAITPEYSVGIKQGYCSLTAI